MSVSEGLSLRGVLKGHGNWVTSIATSAERPNMILSGSRDKSVVQWNLTRDLENPTLYSKPEEPARPQPLR